MIGRLLLAVGAVVAATSLSPALAQRTPPPGASDKNLRGEIDGARGRSNEMERVKRDAEKPGKKAEKSSEDKFPQIKEDFERIQIVNGEVLQAATPPGGPDYARLSAAAEEVRRRATRLKSNLFPQESEEKQKAGGGGDQDQPSLKSLLSALDAALARFVGSPIFRNTQVVNPQESAEARRDLEEVIKLSTQIVKESGKMKKPSGG